MDPQTIAFLDKVIVTAIGIVTIAFIYWFFFGKQEKAVEASGEIKIIVEGGYKPSVVKVQPGQETKLTFIRRDENSCLEEIILPDFKIKQYLPLNQPVTVTIMPTQKGEFDFHCGMNMYHGKVVAA